MISLTLPFPPSVNHYWKHAVIKGRAKVYISPKGKVFLFNVAMEVKKQLPKGFQPISHEVRVNIRLHASSKRKYDADNCMKSLFDSLTKSRVWLDDSQVKKFTVEKCPTIKGGLCTIEIFET